MNKPLLEQIYKANSETPDNEFDGNYFKRVTSSGITRDLIGNWIEKYPQALIEFVLVLSTSDTAKNETLYTIRINNCTPFEFLAEFTKLLGISEIDFLELFMIADKQEALTKLRQLIDS